MSAKIKNVEKSFALAQERYAALGVNVNIALAQLAKIPISLHCWQGDDVGGFENFGAELGGGLAVTGNYPGKARTPDELRSDLDKALSLIPGKHRLNLHAFYGEFDGQKVDRDEVGPEHFKNWIAWAKANKMGMDFNPTYFAHPKAKDGFTLSHSDKGIRKFWIEHGIRCREIGAAMGKALGTPCVTNVWIPDGYKDTPVDRKAPRERLAESLDAIFAKKISPKLNLDAVEPKLFGIGSESYVTGSHEFYLGYAVKKNVESRAPRVQRQRDSGHSTLDPRPSTLLLCLDAGHYHPTEGIADKISSVLLHLPEILLHVSRGVRWDSDHVVILNDDLQLIAQEIVRNGTERVHIGLDYFDASINRVAAWTIGTRNMLKALLMALLEPGKQLKELEAEGDFTARLVLLEELKSLPFGAVWDFYCLKKGVPVGESWLGEVKQYEKEILSKRV